MYEPKATQQDMPIYENMCVCVLFCLEYEYPQRYLNIKYAGFKVKYIFALILRTVVPSYR